MVEDGVEVDALLTDPVLIDGFGELCEYIHILLIDGNCSNIVLSIFIRSYGYVLYLNHSILLHSSDKDDILVLGVYYHLECLVVDGGYFVDMVVAN